MYWVAHDWVAHDWVAYTEAGYVDQVILELFLHVDIHKFCLTQADVLD